ncbi:MAG TPA: hypothetical protein VKZ86_07875 [Cyclobacteriaceae bacterium]|nr:hypothetical protein [Cyclobacteriaceae bacterium]
MALTLYDFRVMPFEKKCDVITFEGNYLLHRNLGECKVFLYHTSEFFIEVFFSTTHQKVLMINAFDNVMGLYPYLDKISLGDLVDCI